MQQPVDYDIRLDFERKRQRLIRHRVTRTRRLWAICVTSAALVVFGIITAARAEPGLVRGSFCDTPEQLKQVISGKDIAQAEASVNQAAGATVCGSMAGLVDSVTEGEEFTKNGYSYVVMEVHFIAVMPAPGVLIPADSVQYALKQLPGEGV